MKTGISKFLAINMAVTVVFGLLSTQAFGQGREFIRQNILKQGECRNVAITKTNGDLMLYGLNGYARTNCPESLNEAIDELHADDEYIDDIQLTENGSWLILYGNNGFRWNDVPYSLEKKLRQYNEDEEVVYSVTFNDAGDWIIISENYFNSSDPDIDEWLMEGAEKHGELWAACVTDDALVAVYERGYKFFGEVPESLKEALRSTSLDVYRVKIAGDAWFFADKEGRFKYRM